MKTPQVTPPWRTGIWNGRNVMVQPVDDEMQTTKGLADPNAWSSEVIDEERRFVGSEVQWFIVNED